MKKLKARNSLFTLLAIASLILSLGTGCGSSSSKSTRPDSIENPPKNPSSRTPDHRPDESGIPANPPPRDGEPV